MKMKLTILVLMLATPLSAQFANFDYVLNRSVSLSSSGEAVTIQQPAANANKVQFRSVNIGCSVTCTVTLERDGAAATSTAQVPVAVSHGIATGTALGFVASNVGAGTVVATYQLSGGQNIMVDLSSMAMLTAGTNVNVTLRCSSITGTFTALVVWREFPAP